MSARRTRTFGPIDAALAFAAAHADLRDDVKRGRSLDMTPLGAVAAHAHLRRELLAPAVDATLRTRSAAESGRHLTTSLLVVGAGPLGAALASRASAAGHDVLVIDDAMGGGVFASQGAAFRLNTPSAAGAPGTSLRDDDDLHPGFAVALASLSGARFPAGAVLADAARLTLALSDARVKLNARVEAIHEGTGARLTLADGTTIDAAHVLWCTGFGRPRDATAVPARTATARDPRVLNANDVLARAAHAALPLASLSTSSLAVIGAGPSALAVLALALGLGPHEELEVPGKLARHATAASARAIVWVTGASGPASALAARERMRAALPHTMAFAVQQAVAATLDELVHLEAAGVLRVIAGRASWRATSKRVTVDVDLPGRPQVQLQVARAIVATGYTNDLARLWDAPSLRALVDGGRAHPLGLLGGAPAGLRIGRSLVVGAALEELVPAAFDEAPYAGAYLRALPLVDALLSEAPSPADTRAARRRRSAPPALAPGTRGSARAPVPSSSESEAHAFAAWTAPLDVRLALACFDLRGLGTRTIDVEVERSGRNHVHVRARGLDDASVRALTAAMSARLLRTSLRWGTLRALVSVHRGRIR